MWNVRSTDDSTASSVRSVLVVVLFITALLVFVAGAVRPHTRELSHGFAAYYTSARLVASGEDPADFYDNRWFLEQTIDAGFAETPDIYNVNPPTTALLFLPLQWLSPEPADVLWTALNLLFLTAAILVLFQTMAAAGMLAWHRDWWLMTLLTALALIFNPVHENFRYGQAYLLLLLLTALAMRAYTMGQSRQTGVWLGVMLVAKSSGALLWLAPLLDRRFRTLIWGGLTVAAASVLAAPLLGVRVWWEYAQWLPSVANQRWTGVTAYQTTASLIHHLTKFDASVSPQPILDAGWIAGPLTSLLTAAIVVAAAVVGWRFYGNLPVRQLRLARFAMLSALAVPLQPVGEEHHYSLLLPAVFVGLVLTRGRRTFWIVAAGVLLLAAPLPFKHDALRDGWLALLAYPKVYGALLVAGGLAATMTSNRIGARDDRSGRIARPVPRSVARQGSR